MENLRTIEATDYGSSDHWYALRCKSNMEFIVNDQLKAKLIPNYLPVYTVKPVYSRSHAIKPYFPGYLFVNDEPEKLYAEKVFLMRGVIGLVQFDGIPASVRSLLRCSILESLLVAAGCSSRTRRSRTSSMSRSIRNRQRRVPSESMPLCQQTEQEHI